MRPRVFVSSSRMPFAVQEIRKLGETGHEVYAADTFSTAPGRYSRHVEKALLTPAPTDDPRAYVEAVSALAREHDIERLIPTFEEGFYLARYRDRLPDGVELFTAPFETLARLHNKAAFAELCAELEIPIAPFIVARSRAELAAATRAFDDGFFARPAFSRGGLDLLTDRGPLAGELELEDCSPSDRNPWLVQPFLRGEDRCSFAIAQHGRLVAHVAYVHPQTIEHAGGIVFESITDDDMSAVCRRIIEATRYHGQLAFDFIRGAHGLRVLECNPRATAGVAMLSASELAAAMSDALPRTLVVPSGRRCKISVAIVRQMLRDWRRIPEAMRALLRGGEDLYATFDDPLPGLFQLLSYVHVLRYRVKRSAPWGKRSKLMAAYLHDLRWDGEPLA